MLDCCILILTSWSSMLGLQANCEVASRNASIIAYGRSPYNGPHWLFIEILALLHGLANSFESSK